MADEIYNDMRVFPIIMLKREKKLNHQISRSQNPRKRFTLTTPQLRENYVLETVPSQTVFGRVEHKCIGPKLWWTTYMGVQEATGTVLTHPTKVLVVATTKKSLAACRRKRWLRWIKINDWDELQSVGGWNSASNCHQNIFKNMQHFSFLISFFNLFNT